MDNRSDRITRRGLLVGTAAAAGAATTLQPPLARPASSAPRTTTLRRGTNLAAQLSPDGRHIAIDAVGVLWVLPASGGAARRLTSDLFDIAQPDWSPDSRMLVFQSYREGSFDLWTIRPDGGGARRLTRGPHDHREPRFSPDGRFVAFSSDRAGGSYGVYTYELATGMISTVANTTAEEYEPAWSPDGRRIAFVVANTRIDVVELATGARSTAVSVPAGQIIRGPAFTPDGADLVYTLGAGGTTAGVSATMQLVRNGEVLVGGEDVFPFRVSWQSATTFLYTADGVIRSRSLAGGPAHEIGFTAPIRTVRPAYRRRRRDFDSGTPQQVRGIGSPVLSPDGRSVAFRALNDLWTMRLGARPVPVTRDRYWKSDPAWSPDGRSLSYSTDRSGHLGIWVRDLTTGADRHLVDLPDAAAVSASWSPDGGALAFLDQNGALYTVEVASGDVRRVFTATFEPGRPTWSPDGRVIALAALWPYSARFREGLSKILLVDRASGAGRYIDPLPEQSLETRGDDGPVWSPDGTGMAFVARSVLWMLPVGPDGTPTGPARQVTGEVADAPSWSGDGTHLLYLNNGRLRLIAVDGGRPRTVPTPLTWTNATPRGRTVIHAGRMWDGRSTGLRHDVDIVIDGNRIAAVEDHAAGRDGVRVDASGAVVVPGLVDCHHHREMQGYSYGDRQGRLWLSLGITTTRSPGSPAYHMVEERESVQSGARTGPRYFATGEAIDGARVFYNFMRPTYDTTQLALELERAEALDYDMIKTYVRLSPEWQREVIAWAHRRGVPVSSHYHYPSSAWGVDGMEHVGATSRFGYSRTISLLGAVSPDVTDVFAGTGMSRTPTLFRAVALFVDDLSLVEDPRVRTLYPPWEYALLRNTANTAQTADQTANLANLRRQIEHLAALIRAGGNVVTGTDSPIAPTALSLHLNLRAMVRYGVTPHQALVSATSAAGPLLNAPLGQVRPGMLADLAVLGGDPLADITQAANVRAVMVNGVMSTVDELLAPFAAERTVAARTGAMNRILPPVPDHPSNAAYWWHDPHYVAESRHACCTSG